jgi:hypothetical protein
MAQQAKLEADKARHETSQDVKEFSGLAKELEDLVIKMKK